MSIASYRRNVGRRVTGQFFPTCFPSALEQISPYGLNPDSYRDYRDFTDWFCSFPVDERDDLNPEVEEMLNYLFSNLGGLAVEDVAFKRATTPIGLRRVLHSLFDEDYQVAVEIDWHKGWDVTHTLGLLPVDRDHVIAVSNYVPKSLSGIVHIDRIAERLAVTDDKYMPDFPFNNSNITALPPD